MKYPIRYSTNPPSKLYEINQEEENFFDVLYSKLPTQINNHINLIRMANGTITVDYNGYFIGKIKLQGRNHDMLILTSLYESKIVYENFIEYINDWVKYINNYILNDDTWKEVF